MTGHCPRCNSTFYTPDPSFGGAGRNKCLDCGHMAPVVDFHTDPPAPTKPTAAPTPTQPNKPHYWWQDQ